MYKHKSIYSYRHVLVLVHVQCTLVQIQYEYVRVPVHCTSTYHLMEKMGFPNTM